MKSFCMTVVLLALAATSPGSQNAKQYNPRVPTVSFDLVWAQVTPQEFIVRTQADGPSSYLSRNPLKPAQPREEKEADYTVDFTMSPNDARRIFKWAQQANYFNGNFDYTAHPIANTGKKILTYADQTRHFQTVYNHSENKAIQQLTALFQSISSTIEFGRKLQFKHKYDKLGLEDELRAMEDAADSHNLAEIQVIAPTLKSIVDDDSVLNIARRRAKHLLALAAK
ncbi:MAG TPA: hypothetical protein VFP59_14120 [Candidatus Angelobacter sp.]|nr:hypothetical protein [Candidatus Angelobacter sp.]